MTSLASPTLFRAAADFVVAVHAAFVIFVVFGGLLVWRWPRIGWVHVPAALWGVFVEFRGWICPLTPLENYLRERGGLSTYTGDFIEHYVLPVLYPVHLTRRDQIWLGSLALIINVLLYLGVLRATSRVEAAQGLPEHQHHRRNDDEQYGNDDDPGGRAEDESGS